MDYYINTGINTDLVTTA